MYFEVQRQRTMYLVFSRAKRNQIQIRCTDQRTALFVKTEELINGQTLNEVELMLHLIVVSTLGADPMPNLCIFAEATFAVGKLLSSQKIYM